MSRFFTSDWHLGSDLIIKYANRPFNRQIDACIGLIDGCNSTAQRGDVVFHVGDFWLEGYDRHGKAEDKNELPAAANDCVKQISARFILLSGNHDDGHGIEADLKSMVVDLNHNYRNVYVSHFPSDHKLYRGPVGRGSKTKDMRIVLCGHVHDKWRLKYDHENRVLNVNVGVDAWDYKPVRDSQITEMLDFVFDKSGPNKTNFSWSWSWTRKDLVHFMDCRKHDREQLRKIRTRERYEKKGLTPEECARRKAEALARKGIKPRAEKHPVESDFTHDDAVQFGIVSADVVDVDPGMSV